jgi:hypothetical protein
VAADRGIPRPVKALNAEEKTMRPGLLAAAVRDIVGRYGVGAPATASR